MDEAGVMSWKRKT